MTRAPAGTGGAAPLLIVAALLVALPGLLAATHAAPIPPNAPPELDRFLASVRAATPPTARVLVAGAPPALAFYRATYLLYPRTVYSAFPTDYAHGAIAPAVRWRDLQSLAHRDGAGYVLLWALPQAPRGPVAMRSGAGTLIQVQP